MATFTLATFLITSKTVKVTQLLRVAPSTKEILWKDFLMARVLIYQEKEISTEVTGAEVKSQARVDKSPQTEESTQENFTTTTSMEMAQ